MPDTRTMVESPQGCFKGGDSQDFDYTFAQNSYTKTTGSTRPMFDASLSSNLYKNGLTEVNVNGLFGMYLIRSYEI